MRKGNKGFVKRITAWMLTLVMVLSLVMVPAGKVEAAETVIKALSTDTSSKTATADENGKVDIQFGNGGYSTVANLKSAGITKLVVEVEIVSFTAASDSTPAIQSYMCDTSWKWYSDGNNWTNFTSTGTITMTVDLSSVTDGSINIHRFGTQIENVSGSVTYKVKSADLYGSGSSSGGGGSSTPEDASLVLNYTAIDQYDYIDSKFYVQNTGGATSGNLVITYDQSMSVHWANSNYSVTASGNTITVSGLEIAASETEGPIHAQLKPAGAKITSVTFAGKTIEIGSSDGNTSSDYLGDDAEYNYAKLLEASLYFYDANMCGCDVGERSSFSWRDDCHEEDATATYNGKTIDVSGGYHDAGDHAKFGLPQAYSASVLGLTYYEYKDVYEELGLTTHYKRIMDHFVEYFKNCTVLDSSGNVEAFCYQVGSGNTDHNYWGAPENQDSRSGQVYFTSSSFPATDIVCETAAALAIYAYNFDDDEAESYAKKLFAYADSFGSDMKYGVIEIDNATQKPFYGSTSYKDDYALAAAWLYKLTNDQTYADKYDSAIGSQTWLGWVLSWDDVSAAAFLYGPNSSQKQYVASYVTNSQGMVADNNYCNMGQTWGTARYNCALQYMALAYEKHTSGTELSAWADGQMHYILGNNSAKNCYVIGYNNNSVRNAHHRAASGYASNSEKDTDADNNCANYAHTLVGALVGGPASTSAEYGDEVTDYNENEVALDYNAALVAAAAGLYYYINNSGTAEEKAAQFTVGEDTLIPERRIITGANPVAVTGVSLDKTTLALKAGETSTLTATITPSDATTQGVTWSSSDSSVVSVSGSGKTATVKGLKSGNTTITVTTKDGSYTATCTVTVTNPLTAFTLNQTNVSLTKGSTTKVSIASTTPTSPDAYTTSWSSNATSIATVDQSGNVTAVGKGSATITVTANGISKTCTVTVTVPLEAIDLDKSTISLTKGQTTTITASPSPNDADLGTVTWTSSDSSVASVTSTGKTVTVTAKKSGTATITAKTGSIEKTCNVTVTTPVTGITLDSATTPLQLEVDETANALSYTITPSDADNKSVTWSVTGSAVTVDSNGKITAKEKGTATVTVKTVDGNFTATRQINVVGKSVKGISLDKSTLSLKVKDTDTLVATITPSDADDKTVTWESSSPSVATVSNGTVTAVGEGTTTITAKASSFTAQCTVTVAKREQATPTVTYSAATRSKDSVTVTGALSSSASDTTGVLEYSVDGVNWKTAESNGTVTFSGLNEFTKYTVRSRLKGDTTYKVSAVSANTIDIYTLVANPLTIDVSKLSDENYVDALCTQDNSHTITYSNGVLDLKHSTSTYANGYTIVGENSNVKITTNSNKITLNNATIGSLDVSKLNGQTVALTISGDVNIINGITSAYDVDLTIAGTGTLTTNGIQTKGDVTISSGTINVDASGTSNVAISAENITITGGSVTATGGTGQAAITAKNNITIQDSDTTDGVKPNVTANGGAGASAIVAGTEASAEGEGTILLENASIKVDSGDPIEENGTRQSAIATSGEYGKIVIEGDTSISSEKSNDNLYSVDPVDANGNAIIQYSITLTYEDGSTVIVQVKKDSSYTLPAIPSTKGYEKAWVTSDTEYEQGSIFVVTGDVTFMVQASVIYVSGITLNATEKTIEAGDTFTLTANVKPADALDTSVTWSSDNVAVATVDQNGKVTAVAAGTATVTATAKDGSGKSASCAITVEKKITPSDNPTLTPDYTNPPASSDIVAIQGIKITGPTKKVAPGKKVALKVEFTPENSSNQSVVWKVDKPKYATVNNNGVVTTKKAGKGKKVTVTAYSAEDNSIKATYKISIMKDVVKKIKLSAKTTTLKKGKSVTIEAKLTPVKGISKELTWTSSNPKIATVNAKGKVTAKKAGTVKITAKAKDGSGKKATINIKVK